MLNNEFLTGTTLNIYAELKDESDMELQLLV